MWEFWHYFLKRILLSRKISFALITEVIIYISCFTFMNYAVTEFIFANACVEKINDTRWGVINQTFLYGPWGQILSLYLPFLLKATDKQMGSSAFCCFFTKWHGRSEVALCQFLLPWQPSVLQCPQDRHSGLEVHYLLVLWH